MKLAWLPVFAAVIAGPALAQDSASFSNPSPVDFTQPFLFDGRQNDGVGLQGGSSARGRGGAKDRVQTIQLRGLGAGRTLVLINGVRFTGEVSSQGGEVNLTGQPGNLSPEALAERYKAQPQTGPQTEPVE